MSRLFFITATACLSLIFLMQAKAATYVDYSTAGGSYTQDFSSLSNAFTPPATNASVFGFGPGSTINASGMDGWYGDAATRTVYTNLYSSTGTTNVSGGFYVFASNPISTTGALAMITASLSGNELFGVGLQNTTGTTLTNFSVSYDAALFHLGTATNSRTLACGYVLDGATLPTINSAGVISAAAGGSSYTHIAALDFTTNGLGTAQAVNGFAVGNYAFESNTVNGINWTNNGVLWLLWSMGTNSAQSPGLGMYNLTFSTVPEPSTCALFGLGAVALVVAAIRRMPGFRRFIS